MTIYKNCIEEALANNDPMSDVELIANLAASLTEVESIEGRSTYTINRYSGLQYAVLNAIANAINSRVNSQSTYWFTTSNGEDKHKCSGIKRRLGEIKVSLEDAQRQDKDNEITANDINRLRSERDRLIDEYSAAMELYQATVGIIEEIRGKPFVPYKLRETHGDAPSKKVDAKALKAEVNEIDKILAA